MLFVHILFVAFLSCNSCIEYIRDLVAHKAYPLQNTIAYPALDHYSTVMVSGSSPFTRDILASQKLIYLPHSLLLITGLFPILQVGQLEHTSN